MRKTIGRAVACLAAALACLAALATPLGTNIWIGPPTGSRWTDPSNWKTSDGTTLRIEGLRFDGTRP